MFWLSDESLGLKAVENDSLFHFIIMFLRHCIIAVWFCNHIVFIMLSAVTNFFDVEFCSAFSFSYYCCMKINIMIQIDFFNFKRFHIILNKYRTNQWNKWTSRLEHFIQVVQITLTAITLSLALDICNVLKKDMFHCEVCFLHFLALLYLHLVLQVSSRKIKHKICILYIILSQIWKRIYFFICR